MISDNNSEIQTIAKAAKNSVFTFIMFTFFCAWWAKSTGRNTLGWFFLGLFFHVFAAIALLIKTEQKR